MKKTAAVLLLVAIVLSLFACGEEEEIPSGMQKVESEFIDCDFYVPSDWVVDVSTGFAAASDRENRTVSLTKISPEGSYESIDDYYRNYYFPSVENTFKSATLTESYTKDQVMGTDTPACKYVISFEADGKAYTALQVIGANSYYLYIFTYFAPADLYEAELEEIYDVIGYISFS